MQLCRSAITREFLTEAVAAASWDAQDTERSPSFRTPITMSISVGAGESYPGRSFSISQLLHAAKRKLQGTTFAGRYAYNSQPRMMPKRLLKTLSPAGLQPR